MYILYPRFHLEYYNKYELFLICFSLLFLVSCRFWQICDCRYVSIIWNLNLNDCRNIKLQILPLIIAYHKIYLYSIKSFKYFSYQFGRERSNFKESYLQLKSESNKFITWDLAFVTLPSGIWVCKMFVFLLILLFMILTCWYPGLR